MASEDEEIRALVARYRDRGLLGNVYYVSVTKPLVDRETLMQIHKEHLQYQAQLEADRKLFAAGPLLNASGGPSGESMNIYRATSRAAAQEIAENDPMSRTGRRSFEIRPWVMNEGAMTFELALSAGKIKLT